MEINPQAPRLPAPSGYPEEANYYPVRPAIDNPPVPLNHYFWVLKRYKWRILGFVFAVVTAVLLYSLQQTPLYESVATLEIDNQVQMFEVGQSGLQFDNRNFDTVLTTEMQLMDSPAIAQQVIRELRLDQNPDFNPALRKQGSGGGLAGVPASDGASAAGQEAGADLAPALPGLSVRRQPETYLIEVHYVSTNPQLASAIANSAAQAIVQQGFRSRYQNAAELSKWLYKQLEELKAKMERAQERLRAFEKEYNVVNPEDRTNILNVTLQKLQESLTMAQAERLRKESAFKSVENGNLESLTISDQGEPLMRLAERLESLQTQLAEAAAQYGPNHPAYKRVEAQITRVQSLLELNKQKVTKRLKADYDQAVARENALAEAVAKQKEEVERLSGRAAEYGILKREVDSQTKLYDELLRKINEAIINGSIKATNLRLASLATPGSTPVYPKVKLNVLLALLLSTTLAVGVALGSDYLDRTLRSGEQVEQWLSVPVLANLPRVPGKRIPSLLLGVTPEDGEEGGSRALAKAGMPLTEALNMLRTSVLLSAPAQGLKMVLVASAAPAEGKSTVASGLALALAQQLQNGHRVLLVDSDLRRPTIHNIFGLSNRVGLSTILEGQSTLAESALPCPSAPNLMVLPAGPSPRYSSELLTMHMAKVLEDIRQEFRYTVIDSAPLLICADSTILSTMADGVLLVARAGETPRDAVLAALRQLRRVRANILGLVLNQVRLPDTPGYGGYYSSYYYSKPPDEEEE
ncbi:MAG TPA: polysaccharide biosynthesis tyrosine autokinase [Bryobacterales bacterium]|nr:polysaccharide biosynthesis tyrosine autokinase [Bryobacterales bacterium]